jgi:hypothetical protein
MGLFSIGGGLLGAGLGAFSGNSWQGWDNIGSWLMEGLPGMVGGGLAGFGIGAGLDTMLDSSKEEMPKAPAAPAKAPKTLLSLDDPAKAPEVKEAAAKSRKAVAAMQGRGATLLTGPGGLKSDEDKPGLLRKTLGGK